MKKLLFLFILVSVSGIAQTLNDFKYAIVPAKFEFQKTGNMYRLNTITKHKLVNLGFTVFYDSDVLPAEIANNRCDKLYVNVEKSNSFLSLRLIVTFTDCQNKIVFKSKPGLSKSKDFDAAYLEALTEAFQSIIAQNYKYNGMNGIPVVEKPVISVVQKTETVVTNSTSGTLKAEATAMGYIITNESDAIVFRLQKTSNPDVFMATKHSQQGTLIKKENAWFFEYYSGDKLVSEKVDVQF